MTGLGDLPHWAQYLLQGLSIFGLMASAAVIATRAGRNPYWGVAAIIPYFIIVLFWALAFSPWPSLAEKDETAAG
jgi:hypothetical protein